MGERGDDGRETKGQMFLPYSARARVSAPREEITDKRGRGGRGGGEKNPGAERGGERGVARCSGVSVKMPLLTVAISENG